MSGKRMEYCSSLAGHYVRRLAHAPRKPPQELLTRAQTNALIASLIDSGEPFLAGRLGGNEARACAEAVAIESGVKRGFSTKITRRMEMSAGFFPADEGQLLQFWELMRSDMYELDLLGWWRSCLQDYLLTHAAAQGVLRSGVQMCALGSLEPYYHEAAPWSAHLEGRRVLVVHPFASSIKAQFERRERIWEGAAVLPAFELTAYRAVQTIAGQRDSRASTWFEALKLMEDDIAALDFDIALIGCGAYGLPLGAFVKRLGRQAVHLGGALQIMFGIMGRRWESNECVARHRNDSWVRPAPDETPAHAALVENACYW